MKLEWMWLVCRELARLHANIPMVCYEELWESVCAGTWSTYKIADESSFLNARFKGTLQLFAIEK